MAPPHDHQLPPRRAGPAALPGAKTLAFAAAGLALSLMIAVAVLGWTLLSIRGLPTPSLADLGAQAGRNALVAALLGAFGVAVGALIRNQAAAIVAVLLLLMFAIEPVLLGLVPEVGRFGPLVSLPTATQDLDAGDVAAGDAVLLAPGLAVLLLLAWIGAAFAAGAALLRRRDLN